MATEGQIRAARSLLGMSQPEVAKLAGVSTITVKRAEGSASPAASATAIAAIEKALARAGVVFLAGNGDGPGVRLRKPKK